MTPTALPSPAPMPLTVADRALLTALRGWSETATAAFWDRFEPGWRQTLQEGWNSEVAPLSSEAARDRVRRDRAAQARPDWSRIHPSWWLRALKDESPAVQRVVVACAPEAIREPLLAGLGLSSLDLKLDVPPHPEALNAALALWSERLVGDAVDRDDPQVVQAITRLDLHEVTQLIAMTGAVKWAIAGDPLTTDQLPSRARALHDQVRAAFSTADTQLQEQAQADVAQFGQVERNKLGSLGLVTFARLLEAAEPYRVRWALQHLPYRVAKLLRTLMARPRVPMQVEPTDQPMLLNWETAILALAWEQLRGPARGQNPRGTVQ